MNMRDSTTDFTIAAQLCNALVLNPAIAGDAVERHCREALGCDEVRFFVFADATPLDLPPRWAELVAACRASGRPALADGLLALPLVPSGTVTAALCIAGNLSVDATARLDQLAELLSDALRARADLDARRQALLELEDRVSRQAEILDHIHDSVISMDLAGYITSWNRGAEKLFGYTPGEAIGQHILFLYAGEDEQEDDIAFNSFLDDKSREFTVRRRKKSGEIFWASITLSLTRGGDGRPTGMVGYLIDITDRLEAETQLRLHARIFERSTEAVIITDAEFKTLSINKAFTDITGFAAGDVSGQVPSVLRPCSFESTLTSDLHESLRQVGSWQGELWDWRKDDQIFPAWVSINAVKNDAGKLTNYFIVMSDITERKQAEQQIYRLAYYDALTGLPNRALLYSLVEQAITESHRREGHGAMLVMDINRFKHLNDSFGHSVADTLLQEVAQRLSKTLRSEDVIARVGGDEFVIGLFDLTRREHAGNVAQKILAALAEPFRIDHFDVVIGASIGIAVFPEDGRDAESLIRCADVAMFKAKRQFGHGYVFYSEDMNLRSIERLTLETGLRRAIERGEFLLHYQPQIDLLSGRLIGAEALIRWQHPEHGMVSPAQFIPVAEETGLIMPIGEWVIDEACRQLRAWQDAGLPLVRVAVNLSARQFRPDLPAQVTTILDHHGIHQSLLELELTESMLMQNAEAVIEMMNRLHEHGLALSLDDFGTGFSSLAYLKRFPIDKLKIDQSFVRGIPAGAKDMAIARTIINLGQNLELKVLAEGVETEKQAEFLRRAGCDQMQGYLHSKPVAAADFASFLRALRK